MIDPINRVERIVASEEEREAIVRWSRLIYEWVAADMAHICWSGRSATEATHVLPLLT